MRGLWKLCLLYGLLGAVQCQDYGDGENTPTDEDMPPEDDMPPEEDMPPEDPEPGDTEYPPGDGPMTSEQLQSLHAKIDGDNDGKVSVEELLGFSQKVAEVSARKNGADSLEHMDLDKDGKISLQDVHGGFEMWEHMEDKAKAQEEMDLEKAKFKVADRDGDGFLDKSELPTLMHPELHPELLKMTTEALMKQKDKDGNAQLTKMEFFAPETPAMEEGAEPPPMEEDESMQAEFQQLDKDQNNVIDMEELKPWVSGHFWVEKAMRQLMTDADKDGDGHVTFVELDEAKEKVAGTDAHYHLMDMHEHHGEL